MWEDHRLSEQDNLFYDCYYSRKTSGNDWFRSFRVNEVSSMSDSVYIGDYFGITKNDTTLFGVWTDRRDKSSASDPEDDAYGALIISGGATPE